MVEAGLLVTVNTDIPAIIGSPLSAEYAAVSDVIDEERLTQNGWSAAPVDDIGRPAHLVADPRRCWAALLTFALLLAGAAG